MCHQNTIKHNPFDSKICFTPVIYILHTSIVCVDISTGHKFLILKGWNNILTCFIKNTMLSDHSTQIISGAKISEFNAPVPPKD